MKISVDRNLSKAKIAEKKGDIEQAEQLYNDVLAAFPNNARARNALNKLKSGGPNASASAASVPQDQLENLISLYKNGRLGEAIELGETLVDTHPRSVPIYNILGAANSGLRRLDQAIECFTKALQIKPDYAEAHNNLGNTLQDLCRGEEAIACYSKAMEINTDYAEANYNLGKTLRDLGRGEEAIDCYSKALKIKPDYAEAHYSLGNTLQDLGRHEEAIACYTKALEINPDYAEAHNNLGNTLSDLGQAIECYTKALEINPDLVEAHYNLGNTLLDLCRREEAIECYTKALEINPDYAMAHNNLGTTLSDLRRYEEAIECYTRALQIKPDLAEAHAAKLHQQANICDWGAINADADAISTLGISGDPVLPFSMLAFEDNPARHRIRSERYALKKYPRQELPSVPRPNVKPKRLRIGYFSADFRIHPLMRLAAKLFETHDRDRFTVHAYSYGPENSDAMRKRARSAFDVFHDVRSLSDKDAANLARRESIDIAIDLTGHTTHSRFGIFAYGAAPIQINYLGYPGTLGADYFDYIIADHTLIPRDKRDFYSETMIYLPHSYLVNDNDLEIANRVFTRADMDLPEQGFVFCCFNNNYKINPEEFDIWMRLLDNVEGSVLWLFKSNKWAEANLKKEAQKRGIEAERIVFADRLPLPEHLARHRLADLFLDTFNYNAHTTANHALWAGLPVVTKLGQGFAARVAGSLLNAIDLPELITHTNKEYERLALELATNPEKLRGIKSKLEKNRNTTPLFDTELFARHIENAYEQAYLRYFEGKDPDVIVVEG